MSSSVSPVDVAKSYYDSDDADRFYFHIWGGEDIHIGIYDSPGISIKEASKKTVATMSGKVKNSITKDTQILDLGSGYGGAARQLAKEFGCSVVCLNLSKVENSKNIEISRKHGLDDKITVVDGNFEDLPWQDEKFDLVWCEDAILHSSRKSKVFSEITRVLKSGGHFVFTDPMQSENASSEELLPIYERLHLDSMGTVSGYKNILESLGMKFLEFDDLTKHLITHYDTVRKVLESQRSEWEKIISPSFLDRMHAGLVHWVKGGNSGNLQWGILHFSKM